MSKSSIVIAEKQRSIANFATNHPPCILIKCHIKKESNVQKMHIAFFFASSLKASRSSGWSPEMLAHTRSVFTPS